MHDLIREAGLDEIGFNVAWDFLPAKVEGQPEPLMVPTWRIVLTKRHPLLGHPDLFAPFFLKPGLVGIADGPSRETLKQIVADGIDGLHQQERKVRADALASANGGSARP